LTSEIELNCTALYSKHSRMSAKVVLVPILK
jgi:hypothetical protein